MMLRSTTVIRTLSFMAKSFPSAALMPSSASESGMAPSSMPWGHTYLQKYGSPIPAALLMRAGSTHTITIRMTYLR